MLSRRVSPRKIVSHWYESVTVSGVWGCSGTGAVGKKNERMKAKRKRLTPMSNKEKPNRKVFIGKEVGVSTELYRFKELLSTLLIFLEITLVDGILFWSRMQYILVLI